MIELIPLTSAELTTGEFVAIGDTPRGTRMIAEVKAARFEGERLSARLAGTAAADWALIRPDGVIEVDVRISLQTDDGAMVYLSYTGNLDPQLAVDMLGLFEDINETGVTTIFATHDRTLLDRRPHRVVVLDSGKAMDAKHGLSEPSDLAGLQVA